MSLNMACEGKVYPTTPPYQVGREKIREFATAIGGFNPAWMVLIFAALVAISLSITVASFKKYL